MQNKEAPTKSIRFNFSFLNRLRTIFMIYQQEFSSSLKKSLKMRILLFLFAVPFLLTWLFPQTLVNDDIDRYLANRMLNYFGIINFDFIALITQIILIMASAELIARELEEKTLPLLIIKPINRSDILIGKFLGLFLPVFVFYSGSLFLQVIDFYFKYGWSVEELITRIISSWLPVICMGALGFSFLIILTIFFSLMFSRGIYGALASIVFFIGNDILFVNNPEIRFSYQLGVVIEEMVDLGKINIYQAHDPLFILIGLISLLIFLFNLTLIMLYRREFS